jgi:hypothetical protein
VMETTELGGDVVVFNHNLKHAAFHGGPRRRMFTVRVAIINERARTTIKLNTSRLCGACFLLQINLCQRYPVGQEDKLRNYLEGIARFQVWSPYSEIMKATAGPRRMQRLQQVLDNQDHLPALARAVAESGAGPARG